MPTRASDKAPFPASEPDSAEMIFNILILLDSSHVLILCAVRI